MSIRIVLQRGFHLAHTTMKINAPRGAGESVAPEPQCTTLPLRGSGSHILYIHSLLAAAPLSPAFREAGLYEALTAPDFLMPLRS